MQKQTKKALVLSVLSLVLCVSMLVGTTFAWFTDSVTTGVNQIVSGTLDIALDYYDAASKTFKEVDSDTLLFKDGALWEPGYTEVVYLKITNAGNLALQYQLNVNVYDETPGKNVAGEEFKLSDHLVFKVVDIDENEVGTYTRETAMEAAGTVKGLKSYNGEAVYMEKQNDVDYVALILYMPTDVGNEANYRIDDPDVDKVPTIKLGVNLFATQYTYENDSFDNTYDKDAAFFSTIVTNEEELKEAFANAKNGDVIGIKGNVTWTTGGGHGSTPFVENATTYALRPATNPLTHITLAGVDETATFTAIGAGVGEIGIENGTVIFKNLKIADQSVSYNEGAWELGYLEFRGNTIFENCDIVNAISMDGDSAIFKNCTINSNKTKEYAVWISNGTASFENCTITGPRGLKVHEAYGSEVASVSVNNCTFVDLSEKPGMAIGTVNADTAISLTNNKFYGTQAGDQGNYKYESDTDVTTFNFTDKDNVVAGYADSTNDLKDVIANAKNGDTIVLDSDTEISLPSLSDKEGITIEGNGDVNLSGVNSFGFGTNNTFKNLSFEGANAVRYGYTKGDVVFENCTFTATGTYGFHVDNANGGTITFNNCTFVGFNAFASTGTYTFNECVFKSNGSEGHTNMYGTGTFNDCTFEDATSVGRGGNYPGTGTVIIDGEDIGYQRDFIGSAKTLSSFRSTVDKYGCKKDQSYVLVNDIDLGGTFWYPIEGAFAGTFDGNGYAIKNMDLAHEYVKSLSNVAFFRKLSTTAVIKNVTFDNANVYGEHYVGVIVGWEGNETANARIENCTVVNSTVTCNTDAANDNGDKAGLIAGYAVTLTIKDCTVKDSTVKAYRDFGGILGYANGSKVIVTGNTVDNVTLEIDNDVNYKNYTTDAQHDANPVVGEIAGGAKVENNIVK